jgi:hypothetical protein
VIQDESLVMVGHFRDPVEAQMAKGMLEAVGIECFLEGANANSLVPMAFRVRLKVRQGDEDAARVMLMEAEIADGE